jgi:hypothetical protein
MRAVSIAAGMALWAGLAWAQGPELIRRERQIPVSYIAPTRQTAPKASTIEAARKGAKEWLTKYAIDKPRGWKITGWQFKGEYSGPATDGRSWDYYRMTLNPPLEAPGGPQFELYFAFDGKELMRPAENHGRDVMPPRAPAVIELPSTSIGGVRQTR